MYRQKMLKKGASFPMEDKNRQLIPASTFNFAEKIARAY